MPKTLLLAMALVFSTAWLPAQDQYPSSGSSQPSTSQPNSGQMNSTATGANASGQTSVEGCLQGSSGNFTLTDNSGTTYQLQGDTSKLNEHIGHEVRITGSTSASAGASASASGSDNSNNMSPSGARGSQQTLTVEKVKHVSKT